MEQWLAEGVFKGAPVDLADGYIHLSASRNWPRRSPNFAGQQGLSSPPSIWRRWARGEVGSLARGALFPHNGDLPLARWPRMGLWRAGPMARWWFRNGPLRAMDVTQAGVQPRLGLR
jgi:hypothetical protein